MDQRNTQTLTNLPGKHFRGVLLLVPWVCSFRGNGPQNNQHQAQTQLRLHSFLYCQKNKQAKIQNTEELFHEISLDFSCK